jgi:alkanesulfonate monooxygenase SsuD/methylene tetrahydromethanopterin reductase-like flavin-dependent oxidoreductase (luciferase family)
VGAAWAQRIADQQRFDASLAQRSEKLGLEAALPADHHRVDVDRRPGFTEHAVEVKPAGRQLRPDGPGE